MKVIDIIKNYLESNGFDGLYLEDRCACKKDDLAPCGEMSEICRAGYLQADHDDEFEFVIGASNPLVKGN